MTVFPLMHILTFRGAGVVVVVVVVVTSGVVVVVTSGVVVLVVVTRGVVVLVLVVVPGEVLVVVVNSGVVPVVDVVVVNSGVVPVVDVVVVIFAVRSAEASTAGMASGASGMPHEVIEGNNTPTATAAARCSIWRRDRSSVARTGVTAG